MKINKTEKSSAGKAGDLRAKFPGQAETQIDGQGRLAVQITTWVSNGTDGSDQHQVALTDGDIERLLTCLAHPRDADTAKAVSKLMKENLRNALRLVALGSGTALVD
ncbi:MAG: hypothetical protein WBF69_05155 [Castellaniella sp.]|uniref:hypothetical protein n=1 Tax=Castellaniella sp. TaxID=1955812 RepID=UPI003C70715C